MTVDTNKFRDAQNLNLGASAARRRNVSDREGRPFNTDGFADGVGGHELNGPLAGLVRGNEFIDLGGAQPALEISDVKRWLLCPFVTSLSGEGSQARQFFRRFLTKFQVGVSSYNANQGRLT
jgi:hypothetical protein